MRTANERDAFRAFEQRLGEIQPRTQVASGDVPVARASASSPDDSLAAVRHAYESTVMSVPHYDVEYDESYAEHVTAEFGADIATVLTDGTRFAAHHRQAVIAAATTAVEKREQLLAELDEELTSLEANATALRSIGDEVHEAEGTQFSDLTFGSLEGYYTRMETLEGKCTERLDDRQATLVTQRRRMSLPIDAPDIAIYLYQDLDVNYPIVSKVADLLDRIETLKTELNRAIYSV